MSDVIKALQAERRSYVARGLDARVAQVDSVLADLGVSPPKVEAAADDKRPAKRAAKKAATKSDD